MTNKLKHSHSLQEEPENPAPSWNNGAILLVDLDAFFASVEQLDNPQWRGKPVIVGGDPEKRGVVSTASYEARRYGVHSAMPSKTAQKLCPNAYWSRGNFHRYREMSNKVMEILYQESPHLMQVSIDEAFLDITPTRINREDPVTVAKRIQKNVSDLGITCSIGLGSSKSVAKIASNMQKPRGLTVVYPGEEKTFLFPLPVNTMSGIGSVAHKKLKTYGIHTLGDLANADLSLLKNIFGKNAQAMQERCIGIDSPVIDTAQPAKSISNEISLAKSTNDKEEIKALIATTAHKVGRRLRKKDLCPSTLHLKIRFEDLSRKSCQKSIPDLGSNEFSWLPELYAMLDEIWDGKELVRLIGVGVSKFNNEPLQTSLFDAPLSNDVQKPLVTKTRESENLLKTTDEIANKFGEDMLRFGHELRMKDETTGSSAKNPDDYRD